MPDGQTKIIEVPGVGTVEFPASMADKDIGAAIQKHLLSDESYQAAHPPSAKPMAMEADSPARAALTDIAANQKAPTIEQMSQANRDAAKFGADSMIGQEAFRPIAQLAETHALPAIKSIPYAGKVISAIDQAPGAFGKAVRGATVGGTLGGAEGLIRGHGVQGSLNDAAKGALYGGAAGVALPAIHKFSGVEPEIPEHPVYGPQTPTPAQFRQSAKMSDAYAPAVPVSRNPTPGGYTGPVAARAAAKAAAQASEAVEAQRQAEAATSDVSIVPEPRATQPGDRPGSAWSLTRTEGLPEAAQRGQPGAIDVLRQIKPTLVIPRGADIETPSMEALRQSLGVTGNADAYSPHAPEVPQGNPTPFGPSITEGWLKPRKQLVLQ